MFTPKQKEVIEIAKKKGFITHADLASVYSSPISRNANLERFVALGLLTTNGMGTAFKLNVDVLNQLEMKGGRNGKDKID